MTRRLRHLVRPTRPLLAAAILAALTLPASPAAAETGATNAPAPAVAAPAPVSAETAPRVFAVAGPAPGSSSAETERPFPCNTETGGYHRVRYQTLFDPLRIYFLGRNCSETDSVNARIRHLGYPSYPDRIVCVGPMQSVFHGVQVGRPNQPWEPWDYTYGVGCDQDPPEMGVPTPPLPPPTGPVPPPPPPTCPPDEPTAPWCGQDPTPPVVNVTGTVTAPVNSAEPRGRAVEEQRPLSWANYEMRYKKRNGQWEMLRQGPGNTGDPVRGHLNAAGEFEVEFVYPQDYRLDDETLWQGCAPTDPPVAYLRSHACAADDVQLRVFADSHDESVKVEDDGEREVATTIDLGRFFEPGSPTTHPAASHAALAYRAAYNVKDLVGGFGMGDIDIQLVPPGTKSTYSALLRSIDLERDRAGTGVAEHEVGHAFMHHLYGEDFFELADDECLDHSFMKPSPLAGCALVEGFAHWLALAAENGHGRSGNAYLLNGSNVWLNLERCEISVDDKSGYCHEEGEKVEARVAGALWDLYDSGEALSPVNGGFSESSSHSLATIVETFRRHEPLTFTEFWNAWREDLSPEAERRDRESVYLNTLVYTGLLDDFDAEWLSGHWETAICFTCVRQKLVASQFGVDSELVWRLGEAVPRTGLYDIWVRLPRGTVHNDSRATYEITTSFGVETVTLDHTADNDTWINLGKYGFELLHDTDVQLRLLNGPAAPGDAAAESLLADAVIVAPHQD